MRPAVKLLGPAGEELGVLDGEENRTWVERDALGREVASWRESGPRYGALSTPYPASTNLYNLAGQVVANWDANSTKVTRWSRYDEAGRLVYVTTDPATGEGIEYYFGPGDLGRVTEVREVSYPVAGGAASVKVVARNHYDIPYYAPDLGYSFVAGKLSWTENAETTIAYGFDDAGRVSRRDQWFARLDATKRFTVSSTYGTDGRVLESRVVNPYSATAEFQYLVDYDSAGHPVALSAKLASQASLVKVYEVVPSQGPSNQYGGYDALGRVPVMRADDGRAVSARRYNGYSGALEGECKRFGDAIACGTASASTFGSPPALDSTKDIYRTDQVAAAYRGAKLFSYEDSGTATLYFNYYLANGRLATALASPKSGTVGSLTQDWLETFASNGIGNLGQVTTQRNTAAGNARPDQYETERYTAELSPGGQALDRVAAVVSRLSATNGGAVITGAAAATAGTTVYGYDLLGHLTKVTRSVGESEVLVYAPGGELLYRQVGEKFTFYVGEYATVTAKGVAGCGASCTPQAATVEVDNHVIFAGTRIASVKPSRALYYYRTRLGTVVATSYRDSGGYSAFGAGYRYSPYGEVELSVNETDVTRSELGYTNALRLTGSLLYLKNRVYDAEARVFIQADTVDRLRYAYVEGDPVNASDPTGLMPAMLDGMLVEMNGNMISRGGGDMVGGQGYANSGANAPVAPPNPKEQTTAESKRQKSTGGALQEEQDKVDKEQPPEPQYIPAPKEVLGTKAYYEWRYSHAPESYRRDTGPEYYRDFGARKFEEFQEMSKKSESPALKEWVGRAGLELQLALEQRLKEDPGIETRRATLLDAAVDTHDGAYRAAGFCALSWRDKLSVAVTGLSSWKDFLPGVAREMWQSRDMVNPLRCP
jgi:RHS repeat-associated protein